MTVFSRELKIVHNEIVKNSIIACMASPFLALVIVGIAIKAAWWVIALALVFGLAIAVLSILDVRKYKDIQEAYKDIHNTLKTRDVKLKSPKVKFLLALRGKQAYTRSLIGIVLTDENKNRYYYILPEPVAPAYKDLLTAQEKIKERFDREFCIQCYENTNVIRSVEKNIHFLRFHLGKLSD